MQPEVARLLRQHHERTALLQHPFFRAASSSRVNTEQAAVFLGQWWHPLHYFPVFLSRTIAVLPYQPMQTAVSKILFQELGEGDAARAHERLFVSTMTDVGFDEPDLTQAPPFEETRRLVEGYAAAPDHPLSALGFLYATETADLVMVSGLGDCVRAATGATRLPWVDIHVVQEPDHVDCATDTLEPSFAPNEVSALIDHAARMWRLWIDFFDRLHAELGFAGGQHATAIPTSSDRIEVRH
jgi:hypothetical protein